MGILTMLVWGCLMIPERNDSLCCFHEIEYATIKLCIIHFKQMVLSCVSFMPVINVQNHAKNVTQIAP